MPIEAERHGNALVLQLSGDIDAAVALELRDELQQPFAAGQKFYVLDLQKVTRLCHASLWQIYTAWKVLRQQHGDLILAAPSDESLAALQATGLDELLQMRATVPAALASF